MKEENKKEELQSRRDFFRKAAKAALPILGAIALASTPIVSNATETAMGCLSGCSASCHGTCSGGCMGCTGGCTGSCLSGCTGSCKFYCSTTCRVSCSTTCVGSVVATSTYNLNNFNSHLSLN